MNFKRACLLLVATPLLSGCLTGLTIEAAYARQNKRLPDHLERIERVKIIGNERMLLFVEARLTNSSAILPYTISVPLVDINTNAFLYQASNSPSAYGYIYLRRNAILDGWSDTESFDGKEVMISESIDIPQGTTLFSHADKFRAIEGKDTVIQINFTGTKDRSSESIRVVYVSQSRPELFSSIQLMNQSIRSPTKKGYLFLLPFTVVVDVVTLPIQLPIIIAVAYSMSP